MDHQFEQFNVHFIDVIVNNTYYDFLVVMLITINFIIILNYVIKCCYVNTTTISLLGHCWPEKNRSNLGLGGRLCLIRQAAMVNLCISEPEKFLRTTQRSLKQFLSHKLASMHKINKH